LIDLYCGVGFFGIEAAGAVESFVGVEYDQMAIKAARQNAASRKINNGEFVAAKSEDTLPALLKKISSGPDGGAPRSPAQGLLAVAAGTPADNTPGPGHLCLLSSGDHGAGFEHFVRGWCL